MVISRSPHTGDNSCQLDATFRDPAAIVLSAEIRIADFDDARRQNWWNDAACRGIGCEDFYSDRPDAIARSLQLCGGCKSLAPCRAEAVADKRLDFGIRGGMDVAARKNARKQLKETPDATS